MPIQWKKKIISHERFESAGIFDVNGDGKLEIVSGAYWYDTLRWRENPGDPTKQWPEHIIAHVGNVETTRAWDMDGDGQLEIVPNTPGRPLIVYKLVGPGQFAAHNIWDQAQGHGLGFGDVNGDGRGDFILRNGWLEAPADTYHGEWIFHQEFDFGSASIPILVVDVNGDGINDLIVGQAHAYGLDWYEQKVAADGQRTWHKHPIDPFNSQYHDLMWVDLDGDGASELISGKRFRAHNGHDQGEFDDIGIYYFKWNGESFSKQIVDYGPPGVGKGCGIHFAVGDVSGNGRLDLVAPGKDGLYFYENLGQNTQRIPM